MLPSATCHLGGHLGSLNSLSLGDGLTGPIVCDNVRPSLLYPCFAGDLVGVGLALPTKV